MKQFEMNVRYLREKEKVVVEMTNKIEFLHTVLADIKVDSVYTDEKISMLEEEVRLLWAASRKNNFDIHLLESKVQSTDRLIEAVTSKVQKMEDIVTEQWIQIRQFDQALKLTEVRVLEAQRRASFYRCTFLKFINGIVERHLPSKFAQLQLSGKESVPSFYFAQTLHQLKSFMGAVKKKHHKLQELLKLVIESDKTPAVFTNQEVIFFLATAVVLSPLWVAWVIFHLLYYHE